MAIVPLLVVLGFRLLAGYRRRSAGRGPAHGFTARTGGPAPTVAAPTASPDGSGGMPAGWFRDPFVRHEQRYWSGEAWTEHVLDGGTPAIDPPPPPQTPR